MEHFLSPPVLILKSMGRVLDVVWYDLSVTAEKGRLYTHIGTNHVRGLQFPRHVCRHPD